MRRYFDSISGKNILLFITVVSVLVNIFLLFRLLQKEKTADLRNKYPLLAPRILTEKPTDTLVNFLPLRMKLREYVAPFGENFTFYFEYLPTGTSIGVNEKLDFTAASLIKVPTVMAYYRQMEKQGFSIEGETIKLEERHIDKGSGTLWTRGIGATITLDEAVRLALIESDNTATYVIADVLDQESFDEVYEGLDIDFVKKDANINISAKSYTSILKALYFSAVLSKEHSQEILSMLSQTRFDDKLVAGIPEGVVVAHKIGIVSYKEVFHDCGIVYVPSRPYALCMISQAPEVVTQERMKKVSRMVYDYVVGVKELRREE
jgi:beta-lactamase class A